MNICTVARTLAVAALLAMTVVSVSAQQADAKPIREKQTHGPKVIDTLGRNITCGVEGSVVGQPQYDWVFYSFGDKILMHTTNGELMNVMCTGNGPAGGWQPL